MKLGFVSAILDTYSFEEMMDFASSQGFKCVEVACWPKGGAERRYAGVSHIDVDNLSPEKIKYIKDYSQKTGVEISALTDIRYDGFTCIEVEDKAFEGSDEQVRKSLVLSKKYLEQFVI